MRTVRVPIPGDVAYGYRDFFGGPVGGVVGNPAWNDDSDSSYVDLYATCHPDAQFSDVATGIVGPTSLAHVSHDESKTEVYASIRCRALTSTGAERPMAVELFTTADKVSSALGSTTPSGSPGWVEVGPMPFANHLDFIGCLDNIGAGTLDVHVNMGLTADVADFTYPGVRVYEVHLIVRSPGGYAPPCRILKRGDRADLGGARNYPPSKMQQTSSRGVGAY